MRSLVLVLVLVLPVTAYADELDESLYNCKPRTAEVAITFKPEVEVKELLSWAVGFTCKKFIYDPRIVASGRKVTLIAPGKQTPAQAYHMFTTALGTLGLTAIPRGNVLEIVESATGKTKTPRIYKDRLPESSEEVVRYLMRPQYAQAETLRQALSSFKSDAGDVVTVGALVLITDHASNVRDMASIAKLIDVPGGSDGIYTIPVKHADAGKLIDKLNVLLDVHASPSSSSSSSRAAAPKPGTGEIAMARDSTLTPSKILVDERTNTLIVAGSDAAFQRVKALVERLDISLDIEGGASMHVYQLGSAIAAELAKTLNDAISAQTQAAGDKKPAAAPAATELTQLQGPARVIADEPTNKLLVLASGRDFYAIREVIRELDVPRRQVYIEAMILEVALGSGVGFGAAGHGGYPSGDSLLVGGVQMPSLKSYPDPETGYAGLGGAEGLVTGILGKTLKGSLELFGMSIPSYAILFQALADTSRTNILSTMPIIVVDNGQAIYKVGTTIPVKKGVMPTSPTANSSLTTNIDHEKLLLELGIRPHISTDDSVLLEVTQSSKDKAGDSEELGPSWTERSIDTRILVRDQQTVVLGGLIQHREEATETKVPLLGDVPILGYLFKYTKKRRQKMNLLVMLTPYIIKDNLDLDRIRARKQREYEEFAGGFHALDGHRYMPRLDYTRKRGVVEEINRTVQAIETEAAARAALRRPSSVTPGLVEPAAAVAPAAELRIAPPNAAATKPMIPAWLLEPPWATQLLARR